MQRRLLWIALLLLGLALRLAFVVHQPFTNDEGSYLYDAKTLLEGRLPGGDVLTKAPVVAGLFLVAVWLTDGSLFAARFVSALLNALTAIPLAALGSRLCGRHVGWTTGILWLFGAGPIVFAAFGQTEAAAGFFGVSALALSARALGSGTHSSDARGGRFVVAAIAGASLALAFASRKTSVVLILPTLALFLLSPFGHRDRRGVLLGALLGVCLAFAPWLFAVHRLYGAIGIREALGAGYAEIIVGHLGDPSVVRSWVGSPHWALGVGARTAGPLLLLAVAGAVSPLVGVFRRRSRTAALAIPLLWVGALGTLYAAWPTLLPDYLPEFFPAVTLLAAIGALGVARAVSRPGKVILAVLLLAWNAGILWSVYRAPWIGMFTAEAVRSAAVELQGRVPRDEPIFTAALLVPYLSGHRVLFDIAHSFWYRYAFIPADVHRTFLPPLERIEDAVRSEVRWVLVEHFTDYAYLRHPSDLLSVIRNDFTLAREIPNETGYRSNPLLLWKREGLSPTSP